MLHLLKNEAVFIKEAGTNLGFGNACNLGLSWIYAQDPQAIVWIVNPDAYLLKTSVDKVSLFFETSSSFQFVGTIIYTPNAKVWFAGGCCSQNWHYSDSKVLTNPQIIVVRLGFRL